MTSIFTSSCEQLILDLVCVCRLWCGHRWCFSWPWNNHLEDHDQEKNRPWPRNNIHALFEMDEIEHQELFRQLLTAVHNSKEIQVFHYEICHYPTVLFDSTPPCLSLIHHHWLDTCKHSCFRCERMSHMGISHALDRGAMLQRIFWSLCKTGRDCVQNICSINMVMRLLYLMPTSWAQVNKI